MGEAIPDFGAGRLAIDMAVVIFGEVGHDPGQLMPRMADDPSDSPRPGTAVPGRELGERWSAIQQRRRGRARLASVLEIEQGVAGSYEGDPEVEGGYLVRVKRDTDQRNEAERERQDRN